MFERFRKTPPPIQNPPSTNHTDLEKITLDELAKEKLDESIIKAFAHIEIHVSKRDIIIILLLLAILSGIPLPNLDEILSVILK